eukprot:COSAG01_NODE_841_length_13175_cov_26.426124_7_plen_115_part_00
MTTRHRPGGAEEASAAGATAEAGTEHDPQSPPRVSRRLQEMYPLYEIRESPQPGQKLDYTPERSSRPAGKPPRGRHSVYGRTALGDQASAGRTGPSSCRSCCCCCCCAGRSQAL